jgi:hypothetical protein
MKNSNQKIAVQMLAALVAAAIAFLGTLFFKEEHGHMALDGKNGPEVVQPGNTLQMSQSTLHKQKTSTKKEIRRLRNKEQRQRLIEAIKMARLLRRKVAQNGAFQRDEEHDAGDDSGSLSKDTIREAVDAVIEDVKICYEDQLEVTPDLAGRLFVNFEISAEEDVGGIVDHAEIGDKSDEVMSSNQQLSDCIIDTIYTLELPRPKGGGTVKVSYPFMMKPATVEEE